MIKGKYRVAVVTLLSNPLAKYACACFDPTVKEGDNVLVAMATGAFVAAKVEEALDGYQIDGMREIVCKLDMSAYKARIKARSAYDEAVKELEDYLSNMPMQLRIYSMLAAGDPKLAELLDSVTKLEKEMNGG